jgi:hypothetical protein
MLHWAGASPVHVAIVSSISAAATARRLQLLFPITSQLLSSCRTEPSEVDGFESYVCSSSDVLKRTAVKFVLCTKYPA